MIRGASWAARALVVAGMFMLIQAATERVSWAGGASCTVIDIKATSKANVKRIKGLPKIQGKMPANLVKKLARGAFTQWNHFEVLGKHRKPLVRMTPVTVKLASGKAIVMLRNVVTGSGKKARVSLRVTLQNRKGKQLQDVSTSIDVGDALLIVDDALKVPGGKYIFALGCKAK